MSVLLLVVLATAAPAGAQAAPTLKGERLMATNDSADPFSCGGSPTSSFSFSGTATGPYAGTFTETGTVSYDFTTFPGPTAEGTVTDLWVLFTINSAEGVVRGIKWLRATDDAAHAWCSESAGGNEEMFGALPLHFMATITTPNGHHLSERGSSSLSMSGTQSGVAGIAQSSLDETFLSARHRR